MITFPNVKLNLGLSVLRKRPDGFHDLETLFVPYFGLKDELSIVEAPSFGISVVWGRGDGVVLPSEEGTPCPWNAENDLTARAYRLLEADFGLPAVEISLVKNSPVGAGLGGGSADGAFALRMLSEMFALGLSDEVLAGYAARLGSDCPFFIYNRPMLGSGRGEVLEPFELDLSEYEIKVVVPEGVSVSTAEAYRGVSPRESSVRKDLCPLEVALSAGIGKWKELLVNDFEPSVFAAHPEIAALKQSLYDEGALYASMSGSGSALFAMFRKA